MNAESAEAEKKIVSWFDRVADACIARGAPAGWKLVKSELLGTYPNYTHCKLDGAVYPMITKGPRAGKPNWRKPVDGTQRTFILSNDEMRAI